MTLSYVYIIHAYVWRDSFICVIAYDLLFAMQTSYRVAKTHRVP